MHLFKKIIFKIHQVTGMVMSLMFLAWFLSGIVLIFSGFPHLSREEAFHHLKPFTPTDFESIPPPPDTLINRFPELEKLNNRPVYRVYTGRKAQQVFDAVTLQPITEFPKELCKYEAERFLKHSIKKTEKTNRLDQWIPWSDYLPLLPIYKCYMNDAQHTVLYVSSKTGTIIQQTNRKSRWLARVGAIPHWVYFRSLRLNVQLWKKVVFWISLVGVFVSLSGIIAGISRLNSKQRQQKTGRISPYKKRWHKWHHLTGFFFGLFVFTFILSGLFSVTDLPDWLIPLHQEQSPHEIWEKSNLQPTELRHSDIGIWQTLETENKIRKLVWGTSMGKSVCFVYTDNYQVPGVYKNAQSKFSKQEPYPLQQVRQRTEELFPNIQFTISEQTKYDNYYQKSGMAYRPLPAYKITFNDKAKNQLYINPVTGKTIVIFNKKSKIHRWLYRGLHTLDFKFLKEHDQLRKIILLILSLGGLFLSFSGIILSYRWIKRKILIKR